ncbi:MAG: hypothetical protein WC763_04700 [Candidatus Paceibacterota bacterium]|jgi:hypothetical protein
MIVPDEHMTKMVGFIEEEVSRIQYGKILIEITVLKGKCTNVQAETRRSMNLNEEPKPEPRVPIRKQVTFGP